MGRRLRARSRPDWGCKVSRSRAVIGSGVFGSDKAAVVEEVDVDDIEVDSDGHCSNLEESVGSGRCRENCSAGQGSHGFSRRLGPTRWRRNLVFLSARWG